MLGKQLPSFLGEVDVKICIYKMLLRIVRWLSQIQSHTMCNNMTYRLCVGPSITIAMGLVKISQEEILASIFSVRNVLLSSYILKHNGIDCGF